MVGLMMLGWIGYVRTGGQAMRGGGVSGLGGDARGGEMAPGEAAAHTPSLACGSPQRDGR